MSRPIAFNQRAIERKRLDAMRALPQAPSPRTLTPFAVAVLGVSAASFLTAFMVWGLV